jgi:hypothetical protein
VRQIVGAAWEERRRSPAGQTRARCIGFDRAAARVEMRIERQ